MRYNYGYCADLTFNTPKKKKVDWTELILIDLPKLLTIHYHDYREAKRRLHMNHGSGSSSLPDLFHGMQPHFALQPIDNREQEYLRLLTESILRILLDPKDFQSDCLRQLIREILSNLILYNMIESLTDPYTIHMIICKVKHCYKPRFTFTNGSSYWHRSNQS